MPFEPDLTADYCCCCGRAFDVHDRAVCNSCGKPFHLAMRVDVEVEECGQVWINEELEALEFGCNHCLEAAGMLPPSQAKHRYVKVQHPRPIIRSRRLRKRPPEAMHDAI